MRGEYKLVATIAEAAHENSSQAAQQATIHALWKTGGPNTTVCGQVEALNIATMSKNRIVTCAACLAALEIERQRRGRAGRAAMQEKHNDTKNLAAEYKKQRDDLLEFMKGAQVSSGVCCCGDMMDKHAHPMTSGHNPVDMWDHAVMSWTEQIEKFDKEN